MSTISKCVMLLKIAFEEVAGHLGQHPQVFIYSNGVGMLFSPITYAAVFRLVGMAT